MPVREESYNTILGLLLNELGLNAVSEVIIQGKKPDVLVFTRGFRVIIEGKFENKNQLINDLKQRLRGGFCELAVGVLYPTQGTHSGTILSFLPSNLNEDSPLAIRKLLMKCQLQMISYRLDKNGDPEPIGKWRKGKLSDLVTYIQVVSEDAFPFEAIEDIINDIENLIKNFQITVKQGLSSEKYEDLEIKVANILGLEESENAVQAGGLIVFGAGLFYNILCNSNPWEPIENHKNNQNTSLSWRDAYIKCFKIALIKNYKPIFRYAIDVLKKFTSNITLGNSLDNFNKQINELSEKPAFLSHDLMGRVYHKLLSDTLAKAFATYYTKITSGELLATLSIPEVNRGKDIVCDFACGTGTLLASSYHRKLHLALKNQTISQGEFADLNDIHQKFIENQIYGFDAMSFATHITLTNLSLQRLSSDFSSSNIVSIPCRKRLIGSLEFLFSRSTQVIKDLNGQITTSTRHTPDEQRIEAISLPDNNFDVIIMNPPFTRSDNIKKVIGEGGNERLVEYLNSNNQSVYYKAGFASVFFLLADNYIKDKGSIGLVLPSTILCSNSWQDIRNIIKDDYQIRFICISWDEENACFSENTKLREILLVIEKNTTDIRSTIVHLDEHPKGLHVPIEVGEKLLEIEKNSIPFDLIRGYNAPIGFNDHIIGECFSISRDIIQITSENWFRLLAFRNRKLTKLCLGWHGIIPLGTEDPNFMICRIDQIFEVLGAIDHTHGLIKADFNQTEVGIPAIWGSKGEDQIKIELEPNKRISEDPNESSFNIKGKDGWLFVPRKGRLNTRALLSIKSTMKALSNVWFPLTPKSNLNCIDNYRPSSEEIVKVQCLFINSTFGWILFLAERQELYGAMVYFNKSVVESNPILDITQLTEENIKDLISLFDDLKTAKLGQILDQIEDCIDYLERNHSDRRDIPFRLKLDSELSQILTCVLSDDYLLDFYKVFKKDFTKLSILK